VSGLSVEKLRAHLAESEAKKMLAKGYEFKLIVKDKPPLYVKDMGQAKKMMKDYPGAKVVKNEHRELDEAAGGDLSQMLPWSNDPDLAEV